MLFTFAGGTGHFLALVALARVAERAGHVVAFGAQPGMLPPIEEAGFGAYDTGGETLLLANERTPLLELDAGREARTIRDSYAGTIARERARSVHRLCEAWDPDVIVCDELDFGALIAAEVLSIPYATVVCIGSGSWVWPSLVREPLADLRSAHGLPPDPELSMICRHLILSPFPPSFRDPRNPLPENGHSLRLVPHQVKTTADASWLAARPPRPLVYFTLGTIFNLESGDLFERVLEGLSELPLDVVVTVGRELDPTALGRQPANVLVRRYVPQSALLPHSDLCVSHGGSGSVLGALTYGIPMVLLPIGADQPLNASRCKELEVAQVLDAVSATPQDVKRAAAAVLADPAYARNAKQLEATIAALPGPEHGLRLIEQIAGRRP